MGTTNEHPRLMSTRVRYNRYFKTSRYIMLPQAPTSRTSRVVPDKHPQAG